MIVLQVLFSNIKLKYARICLNSDKNYPNVLVVANLDALSAVHPVLN